MFVSLTLCTFDGRTALVDGAPFSRSLHVDVPGNSFASRLNLSALAIAHAVGSRAYLRAAVALHGSAIGFVFRADTAHGFIRGRVILSGETVEVDGAIFAGTESAPIPAACVPLEDADPQFAAHVRAARSESLARNARTVWGRSARHVVAREPRDLSEALAVLDL